MRNPFKRNRKERTPGQKANDNILGLTYAVVLVFVLLFGYSAHFLLFQREQVINNSYNARLDRFAQKVVRGRIFAADGTVLAETALQEDGTETRVYPFGEVYAHAVGYSVRGKTGLESLANFYLLSSHVSPLERLAADLSGTKTQGDDVYTTLDPGLQQAAYDALGDRRGAIVALEPSTGKVLAMVSRPGFDPNTLNEDWERIVTEESGQARLLNRASQGMYPPGSVFKMVMLLEYMREYPEDYEAFHFDCSGVYQVSDGGETYSIQCYHQTAHGQQNLKEAFANSCNGAFASLGLMLDPAGIRQTAQELLFNQELPLSIAYEKSRFALEEGADVWEVLQTSIGQGRTQASPMHIAMITAAAANGGVLMEPYLIQKTESAAGETIREFSPREYGALMTEEEAQALTEMMRAVVESGTGSALQNDRYTAAGKTGSAEYETGKETHAWFTGFAPAEDPQIVVTVIVEEGGSGGRTAGPAARAVMDAWFSE